MQNVLRLAKETNLTERELRPAKRGYDIPRKYGVFGKALVHP